MNVTVAELVSDIAREPSSDSKVGVIIVIVVMVALVPVVIKLIRSRRRSAGPGSPPHTETGTPLDPPPLP